MIRIFSLSLVSLVLVACTQVPAPTVQPAPTAQSQSQPRNAGPGEYQVKRGDTLFRIARDNGLDLRELAALNNISDPTTLREGQILRLRRDAGSGTAPVTNGGAVASPVGVGGALESRPLAAPSTATAPAERQIREPRGGKEPYSDEAHARLTQSPATPAASSSASAAANAPATPSPPVASVPAVASAAPAAEKATTASVEGVVWAWPSAAPIQRGYNAGGNKGIDFAGKQGDPVLAAAEGRVLYVGEALAGYGKLVIIKHSNDHLSVYAHNHRILVKESQPVKLGEKIAEKGRTGTDAVKLHFEIRKQGKPVDPMPFLPKR